MMVMTKASRSDLRTLSTWAARETSKPVPIEDVADSIDKVADSIRAGRSLLKVVTYPWGVEFEVCRLGEES